MLFANLIPGNAARSFIISMTNEECINKLGKFQERYVYTL